MRHVLLSAALVLTGALAVPGCGRTPPPPAPVPVSSWSANDSTAVAQELVDAYLSQPWTSQFRDRNGRAAKIVLGDIEDRSGDHFDTVILGKAIATRLTASDKIAVAEQGADYRLGGVVTMTADTKDGAKIHYFRVSLRLAATADGATREDLPPVGVERAVDPTTAK